MKRISQRELNRIALLEAAAIIASEDFTSIFGEELSDEFANDKVMSERMNKALSNAVRRINSLVRGRNEHT